MKDIDKRLKSSHAPRPARSLSDDFEMRVATQVSAMRVRSKSKLLRSLRPAVIVVSLVFILLALGGVTYALKPDIFNFFKDIVLKSQTKLENGDRVIGVEASNCQLLSETNKDNGFNSNVIYYRVKNDSTLSVRDMAQIAQGWCEINRDNIPVDSSKAQTSRITAGTSIGDWVDSEIIDITPHSLSTRTITNMGETHPVINRTWTLIDPNVVVETYDGTQLKWLDLKKGDHILINYSVDDPESGSTEVGLGEDTTGRTITYVRKNTPNITRAWEFDQKYGKEFTRVVPCKKSASGFCDI